MRKLRSALAGLALALFSPVAASAACSGPTCSLALGVYTDLGAAPVMVGAISGSISVLVSDSQPASNSPGLPMSTATATQTFQPADASSHVWAAGLSGAATAFASPVSGGGATSVTVTNLPPGASTAANQTSVQTTVAPGAAPADANVAGCQYNSSSPAPSTGQTLSLQCDSAGRLQITAPPAAPVNVTVNAPPTDLKTGPTSLTSPGTVTVNSQGAGSVGIQATGSGTGLAFSFQGSVDGSNYAAIQCFPTSTNAAAVSSASANGAWQCATAGLTSVRVNLTAISGGTETFTVNASAGSANGVNATLSAPPNDVSAGPQNFVGAATLAVNAQGSGSTGLVVSGTFTGAAWTLQGSVDGTNWANIPFFDETNAGNIYTAQPGATTTGSWIAPSAGFRQVRINVTAVSTGTLVASLNASAGSANRPVGTQGDNANINGVNGKAVGDPCFLQAKTNVAIATSSGNTQLVAGSASKKVYICSFHIVGAAAYVVSLIEGTGAACTTANEAAIWGSTTAASGDSFPANGGMSYGNGAGAIGQTATAANGICLLQSGTAALSGNITVVQQ